MRVRVYNQNNEFLEEYPITFGNLNYPISDEDVCNLARQNVAEDGLVGDDDLNTLRYEIVEE